MIPNLRAAELLTKYKASLLELKNVIIYWEGDRFARCEIPMVTNIISALDALAENKQFKPEVAGGGLSGIKSLSDNPRSALKELVLKEDGFFKAMYNHFVEKHDALHDSLDKFYLDVFKEYHKIAIYKAKNGELAIEFPNSEWCQRFLKELGKDANKQFPQIYPGKPTILFFAAYTAKNGELAVKFPSLAMREAFVSLLRHAPKEMISIYSTRDPIYFNDKNLHKLGYCLSVNPPIEITFLKQLRCAARIVGQGMRDHTSFFGQFPKEISNKIVSTIANSLEVQENEKLELIEQYQQKPKI